MDEEEKIFGHLRELIRSGNFGKAADGRERELLEQMAEIDNMEEAKNFLVAHMDEFAAERREAIMKGVVDDIDRNEAVREVEVEFERAREHVEFVVRSEGKAKISEVTASLFTRFLNAKFKAEHDPRAVRYVLRAMEIPMQLEEEPDDESEGE